MCIRDRFLDRVRTVVNVEGDLMVVAALAAWEAPPDGASPDGVSPDEAADAR